MFPLPCIAPNPYYHYVVTVAASTSTGIDVYANAVAQGWNEISPLLVDITINSGVTISSSDTSKATIDCSATFPSGSVAIIKNSGTINGAPGAGGQGAGESGHAGGVAVKLNIPGAVLNNLASGNIRGGGGGGGIGAWGDTPGAGAGALGGVAVSVLAAATVDNAGTLAGGGAGGAGGAGGGWGSGGGGGGGGAGFGGRGEGGYSGVGPSGDPGNAGTATAGGSGGLGYNLGSNGTNGGALGSVKALTGNSFVTWGATGVRTGGVS